jgi:hypothetical protein
LIGWVTKKLGCNGLSMAHVIGYRRFNNFGPKSGKPDLVRRYDQPINAPKTDRHKPKTL